MIITFHGAKLKLLGHIRILDGTAYFSPDDEATQVLPPKPETKEDDKKRMAESERQIQEDCLRIKQFFPLPPLPETFGMDRGCRRSLASNQRKPPRIKT